MKLRSTKNYQDNHENENQSRGLTFTLLDTKTWTKSNKDNKKLNRQKPKNNGRELNAKTILHLHSHLIYNKGDTTVQQRMIFPINSAD